MPTVRGPHAVALGLFLLVWLSCIWFGSDEVNPNSSTRMFAAISLVESGDATIDEFETMTIDKAQFDGHYYTDKNPGITLMAMPAVWLADAITGDRASNYPYSVFDPRFTRYLRLRMTIAIAMTSAVLLAFAAVLLFDMATGLTGSPRAGLITALAYGLGTPAWGWSTTLFGHAPVGALLIIATWAIWRGTSGPRDLGRWRYPLMLGACLGWAIVIELPAVLPGAVIGLWAVWRTWALPLSQRLRLGAITATAGIIALLPMLAYNWIAFGVLFKVGYQGVVGFTGMNQGLFGLTYPHPNVLYEITVGPRRGLLYLTPILILGIYGLIRLIRATATRDLGVMAAALIVTVFLYNASYFYWDGGYSTGPRHVIPAMAFMALGLAPLWTAWGRKGRYVIVALLGISMFINLAIAAADIVAPDTLPFPLFDPVMSKFFTMDIRTLPSDWLRWPTWRGLMLYLVLALPLLWFLFRALALSERALESKQATVA